MGCALRGANGRTLIKFFHRLVAEQFIPNPQNLPEVDHIDFDRTNNCVDNLRWISHVDNVKYAIENHRHVCTRNLYGANNPNFGNHKLHDRFINDKEFAKAVQSRPRGKNGRAIAIRAIGDSVRDFTCIRDCAEFLKNTGLTSTNLNSVQTNVSSALKSETEYLGYYYKRI